VLAHDKVGDVTRLPYMSEPWFQLLAAEIARTSCQAVADRLGVSRAAASMVYRGAGAYGTGEAGTERMAERVLQMLGDVECPFLSATTGEPTRISGDQCRGYAYREAPTSSPLASRHWQACRRCERRVSAPRGWDEAAGRFIDLAQLREQLRRASKGSHQAPRSAPGVAAPGSSTPPQGEAA
jgi:hypothetical protein